MLVAGGRIELPTRGFSIRNYELIQINFFTPPYLKNYLRGKLHGEDGLENKSCRDLTRPPSSFYRSI